MIELVLKQCLWFRARVMNEKPEAKSVKRNMEQWSEIPE